MSLDKSKIINMIKDIPDYCCIFDAEILRGDPNCDHDFVKQPEENTWCGWKCSRCHMEVRIGVYE